MGARIEGCLLDAVLIPFIECDNQEESRRLLDHLLQSYARPILGEIVNRKLGVFRPGSGAVRQDVDDVCAEANLRLVIKLKELKINSRHRPISDFKAYVAVTAYNTVSEYLRKRFPNRHSLKNKLRYLISRDSRFELWQEKSGEWGCGFLKWRLNSEGIGSKLIGIDALEKLETDEIRKLNAQPAEQVASIFDTAGSPIELDSLVTYVAVLWNVRDERAVAYPAEDANDLEIVLADPTSESWNESDDRLFLKQVWSEIKNLPVRQRLALLLNLSDRKGRDAIGLLPATGVASVREIATVLELEPFRLAKMWNDLPIEDSRIAEMLGITRQQVINLRNAARRRLGRRLTRSK